MLLIGNVDQPNKFLRYRVLMERQIISANFYIAASYINFIWVTYYHTKLYNNNDTLPNSCILT